MKNPLLFLNDIHKIKNVVIYEILVNEENLLGSNYLIELAPFGSVPTTEILDLREETYKLDEELKD